MTKMQNQDPATDDGFICWMIVAMYRREDEQKERTKVVIFEK